MHSVFHDMESMKREKRKTKRGKVEENLMRVHFTPPFSKT